MAAKKMIPLTEFLVERMERYRVEMNFSQAKYASKVGLSLSGYKKILQYRTNSIHIDRYIRFAWATQKVFWMAYCYGERSIKIADILDEYRCNYEQKIQMFQNIQSVFRPDLMTEDAYHTLVSDLKDSIYYFNSESFQMNLFLREQCGAPVDLSILAFEPRSKDQQQDNCVTHEKCVKINQEIIRRIEMFRVRKGISQERFAEMIGYSLSGYKKHLIGKTRGFSVECLLQIEEILEIVSLFSVLDAKIDQIAVALDNSSLTYQGKRTLLHMFETMNLEFNLPQDYIDGVITRIHEFGEK